MEITTKYLAEKLGIKEDTLNVVAFDTAMVGLVGTVALAILGVISLQAAILFGAVFYFVREVTAEQMDHLEPLISLFNHQLFYLLEEENRRPEGARRRA